MMYTGRRVVLVISLAHLAGLTACSLSTSAGLNTRLPRLGDDRARARQSPIVTTPDVFGMTQAEAEAAFQRAGFERPVSIDNNSACGSVVDGKIIELGRVCSQAPAAGQSNSAGVPITLRIQTENPHRGELGNGRFWFLMPNLVGIHVDKARAKIKELGFVSREVQISYVDRAGCAPNIVCETYPVQLNRTDNTSDKRFYVGRSPDAPDGRQSLDARKPPDSTQPPDAKKPLDAKKPPDKPADIF
jgi:beta-lactam-binding protein with PASTA domain